MYLIGQNSEVYEYNLSTPWDITTTVYHQNFSVATEDGSPHGLFLSTNGTNMYFSGYANDKVYQYDLSTAWDVSTAVNSKNLSVLAQTDVPTGLFFNSTGDKMYVTDWWNDVILEYNLSTPWDVSTASYHQGLSVTTKDTEPVSYTHLTLPTILLV